MILGIFSSLRPGADQSDPPQRRLRRNFIYHLHPLRVSERALHPLATLGLGVITITLFMLLTLTGVLLMIYYVPTTREAYGSMQDIQYAVAFGSFVRALHRWAAHGMVAVVFLHVIRVVFTASYVKRQLNWIIGLGLGLVTLGLAFTGYLLPWDQLSFWAVSVSTTMLDSVPLAGPSMKTLLLGGELVGQATLLRFYTLHVALLPAAGLLLLAFHLWRIRKDGGLVTSSTSSGSIPAWPHLVLREAIVVIVVLIGLCLVSLAVDAPLGAPPDFHAPDNPEKAPWYFLWLQEMVSYSAVAGGVVFPGLLFATLLVLPFLDAEPGDAGKWFGSASGVKYIGTTLLLAAGAFCLSEALYLGSDGSGTSTWIQDLLNPASGMLLVAMAVSLITRVVSGSSRTGMLCGLTVLLVAVVGFTVMGLCRGPDWVFYWPWEEWPLVY
jgi:quinol-cytochrome oxidoreductase complex cytochrome b subunit